MPVGTAGTVKAVSQEELSKNVKAEIILGNTYHLYLRPGIDLLEKSGGLHQFISWNKPILTDSGGYQVYSLSERRKITEEGVSFRSHIDGSKHLFTPENAMDIQKSIGADIIMAFDECTPTCDLRQCIHAYDSSLVKKMRGSFNSSPSNTLQSNIPHSTGKYHRFKKKCRSTVSFDMPGNAIGGLSVGEPAELMYKTDEVYHLPKDKP